MRGSPAVGYLATRSQMAFQKPIAMRCRWSLEAQKKGWGKWLLSEKPEWLVASTDARELAVRDVPAGRAAAPAVGQRCRCRRGGEWWPKNEKALLNIYRSSATYQTSLMRRRPAPSAAPSGWPRSTLSSAALRAAPATR